MLRPRLIPCLLVHKNGLVKTVKFSDPKYVGDPLNAVRIFNEKYVDELIVLNIDASVKNLEPDYKLISKLANECRMPLSYGGGVKTAEQISRIIGLGVEKVCLSSIALENKKLVEKAALQVGAQSVAVVLDVKKSGLMKRYEIVTHNATVHTGLDPVKCAVEMQELGAGEIVLNSVDLDGTLNGYDFRLVQKLKEKVSIPITVIGGAGSLEDIKQLWLKVGLVGAGAGSIFVLKGKYRAVLINYPNQIEKKTLIENSDRLI